ncbi:MAG: serine/threonine-protein kinase [Thermoanaerobaculia bacterium]
MSLSTGERIGPFQIVAPIGRGGMGEIYRARDTRLNREVALKMLPEGAATDEDSLRRFERETRAVAALNHPNILAIHDTGMHRDIPYAVTELLQGETLADRLRSGPLAAPRATEIACQVAEGLAAAHAMGVIHRDIKPDNIFLTNDGRAKILDFGIARIENPALRTGKFAHSSGSSSSVFVMGTAGYISPEQVRGKRADGRSDLFALGAVFFEMLTGRRAFLRDNAVETLGAVLRDDPRKSAEIQKVPETLRGFLFRCLEKDPADRYQSARDLVMDLRAWQAGAVKEAGARVQFQSVPPWRHRRTRVVLRGIAGVLLLLLGFWVGSCWQRERQAMTGGPATSSSSR